MLAMSSGAYSMSASNGTMCVPVASDAAVRMPAPLPEFLACR